VGWFISCPTLVRELCNWVNQSKEREVRVGCVCLRGQVSELATIGRVTNIAEFTEALDEITEAFGSQELWWRGQVKI